LHYTIHMLEHNFARVFEESARLDMFRVYPRPSEYGFRTQFRWRGLTESVSSMHESSTHRFLQTLEPCDTCDCLLSIDNRECLIRLCSSIDSINSSHRCFHAYSFIVLSRATCSIKSRSMLSLALSNWFIWFEILLFLYHYALFLMISDMILTIISHDLEKIR